MKRGTLEGCKTLQEDIVQFTYTPTKAKIKLKTDHNHLKIIDSGGVYSNGPWVVVSRLVSTVFILFLIIINRIE